MKYFALILFITIQSIDPAKCQDTITYHVSFSNAIHHEADITVSLKNIKSNRINAIMSKASPGRYAIHDFGKNVYRIKAFDSDSAILDIKRIKPDAWSIEGIQGSLNINYTLYANHADGTYSGIDEDFANLNIPATLMWIENMESNPIKVIFNLPYKSTWKIATQLTLIDSAKNEYFAPNLQYLMDSPCILGDLKFKEFQTNDESSYTIRMAFNTEASDEDLEVFKEMTEKIILEQKEIFGEYPKFKNDIYTFLCSYGPVFYGDGMEHRNSTMISSGLILSGNQERLIGTISHEFFHVWNIERIRPASLEPFDFTRPNMSSELWFGEGFTSYYGDLTLCRSGIIDANRYINSLSSSINYCMNAPGWTYGSPVYMSEMATYSDQSSFVDETNFANTFLSYYTYGEIIALALDLSLRTAFKDISLDDLMKAMWIKHGKTEKSYSNKDIEATLVEVCKDESFVINFFQNHIYGNQLPDFEALFDKIGYKLIKKNPDKPGLGFVRLKFEGDTATLLSTPLVGSGLYEAGVNKGDLILTIDDQPVTSYPELNFIIGTRKIGDELNVEYVHLGKRKNGTFKLKEENQLVLVPKERFSIRLKEEEEDLRSKWLSAKTK